MERQQNKQFTLAELAEQLDATLEGPGSALITVEDGASE